ncbi:MAG: sugar nucleotide-binding protein [bacterium]|nr:sugar nucleotide-binding protein [bacterium]
MKKVLVIGASGLVGSRFMELASKDLDLIPVDEKTLDITDKEEIDKYFLVNKFDSVLNFAAITNVDGAEKEKGDETGLAWKLNVVGPLNLAEECKKTNRFLVQISTDFVFPGTTDNAGPYSEDALVPSDLVSSMGWYGWTKNRAEVELEKSGARYSITRIAYPFYSEKYDLKLDFAKNYLKLYDEGKLFPIFTDQILSVINVDDLVDPLVKILSEEIEGTFHLVSKDITTPFDFVEYLLLKARNVNGVVQKGSMVEFLTVEGRTPRPRLGGLKTEITQDKLGMKFKTWREMVDDFVASL